MRCVDGESNITLRRPRPVDALSGLEKPSKFYPQLDTMDLVDYKVRW